MRAKGGAWCRAWRGASFSIDIWTVWSLDSPPIGYFVKNVNSLQARSPDRSQLNLERFFHAKSSNINN